MIEKTVPGGNTKMFIDSIASSRRGSPFLRSYIRHAINANVVLKQNCIGEYNI
jgi:hypothetical protein